MTLNQSSGMWLCGYCIRARSCVTLGAGAVQMAVCVCVCAQSCLTLCQSSGVWVCVFMLSPVPLFAPEQWHMGVHARGNCSLLGSSVLEFSQMRILVWVGHFLLQGIFLTQGSNPHLLHWQVDSLPLSHLRSRNLFYIKALIIHKAPPS